MWGARRLDEPTPSQVRAFLADMKANDVVTSRSNYRGGVGAERHMIGAFRNLYRRAEADGLITAAENPAQKVQKPRRLVSTRHALPIARLAEINTCVTATGDDPALDSLLLSPELAAKITDGGVFSRHVACDGHDHAHGDGCGHVAVPHGDNVDYLHDGHRHAAHDGHYDGH